MILRKIIFAFIILLSVNTSIADEICPSSSKTPPPSGAEELKMFENQFNFQHAMNSVQFLEKDVIEILKNHKGPHSVLDYEGFYIGYPNSITFVKGTLLREEALIAKSKLEVAKLKLMNGTGSKSEVKKAEKVYFESRDAFCTFLKSVEYVD